MALKPYTLSQYATITVTNPLTSYQTYYQIRYQAHSSNHKHKKPNTVL